MRRIPSSYQARETLPDGRQVLVRAIRADDRRELHEEFLKLSKTTVRDRFFNVKMDLSPEELTFFTEVDFSSHVALVAVMEIDSVPRLVGTGRFVRIRENPDHSEFAITIADALQGQGVGRALLKHLVRCARRLGVSRLEASVLPQNSRMSKLLHGSGLPLVSSMRDGIVTYSLTL